MTQFFVVRTDINVRPAWLSCNSAHRNVSVRAARGATERRHRAKRWTDPAEAQRAADDWSDVPGVWRVVAVAPSRPLPTGGPITRAPWPGERPSPWLR